MISSALAVALLLSPSLPSGFSNPLPPPHQAQRSPASSRISIRPATPSLLFGARHARRDDNDGNEDFGLFDGASARFANNERNKVRNKYSKAMQYLSGVSLAQADIIIDSGNVAPSNSYANATAEFAMSTSASVMAPSSISRSAYTTSLFPTSPGDGVSSSSVTQTFSNYNVVAASVSVSRMPSDLPTSSISGGSSSGLMPSSAPAAPMSRISPPPSKRDGNSHGRRSDLPTRDSKKIALSTRDSASSLGLTDYMSGSMDILYYGPLAMGSAAQSLTVDFDTGSADLWLPVNCSNRQSTQYDTTQSSTYRTTGDSFSVEYGSGSVSGVLAQDTVQIASTSVTGQYFGAVQTESDDFFSNPNSGVMGMAFSSIASSGKPTYFENLVSNKVISNPMFGFHLARRQASGSSLSLGAYDASKFSGGITWTPLVSQTYWSVSMTGLSAKASRQNALSSSIIGAIDTGTTLIYLPSSVADAFYAQIPGSSAATQFGDGFYQFPCKSSLSISLSFNSKVYTVATTDFNLGRAASGSSMCVGGVMGMSSGFPDNLAIVGVEFLKSWYSIYDYSSGGRVGFAASINNGR